MDLARSRAIAARIDWKDESGSTNEELVRRASTEGVEAWPHLSVLATATQTAGRGRLGRAWSIPPGTSLAASVVVRADVPTAALAWMPLLSGLAMTGGLRSLGAAAALKWPNDVRIDGRKICGILAELLPDLSGVIVGTGVNISIDEADLPVATATSLLVEGVVASFDDVLAAYLERLETLVDRFVKAAGDAEGAGIADEIRACMDTLGATVRVLLPDGSESVGVATDVDGGGRLVVRREGLADLVVSAGEVTHLRY